MADIQNASTASSNATLMALYSHGSQMNMTPASALTSFAPLHNTNQSIYTRPNLYSTAGMGASGAESYNCSTRVLKCNAVAGPTTTDPTANLYAYDGVYGSTCPCSYAMRQEM